MSLNRGSIRVAWRLSGLSASMALNTLAKGPARTRHRAGSRNWLDAETRAQGLEGTGLAPGFSGLAGSPAVQDEPVADSDPFLLGNDLHLVLIYLNGGLSTRQRH